MIKDKKPLSDTHPELAKEAHGWDPKTVVAGTAAKLEWKCQLGHVYKSSGSNRKRGQGCPYCSKRKVLSGFNDMATTHPELAKEAHGWDPKTVVAGSRKKLEWKCFNGHIWSAQASARMAGTGCPFCTRRKVFAGFNDMATTHPELAKEAYGWDPKTLLAGTSKVLSWKCSKGHIWKISSYERYIGHGCPFCSNNQIEIGSNDLATTHPELAQEAHGWDPKTVVAGTTKKLEWKCKLGHIWKEVGYNRLKNIGCPICSNHQVLPGFNDLATTHPELAKQAHGWDPKKVTAKTGKRLTWKCLLGHTWKEIGYNRARGQGCPICSNHQVLPGFNDLATTHPELAKQAHGWDPKKVMAGTGKRLTWKCSEGHKWRTTGSSRIAGRGCPSCANSGFDPNQNGYVYFLIQPQWEIYQIGITNVPENRLGRHKRNGFDLLELRGPMDGQTAKDIESSLLRFLKSQKADLSPDHVAGKFDGYSESWTIDSYKVNNLKELIDKASEAGY